MTARRAFIFTALLILLVAMGLRLYRLPNQPLGLHYDEAANGILAGEIASSAERPIFIPAYTGKEVLFFYWSALWMNLLGITPLALRMSAALVGVATVAATIWAVRELLHDQRDAPWIALVAAAFVATSFWHLILSRYGFRAITQPLLQALTVAALWRGLRRDENGWLLVAGLFCGLTAYTYLAARAFPVPLAAALLTLLVADADRRRERLGQMALVVGVAALVLAPLARYWLTHPGSFSTRMEQVAADNQAETWAGIRASLQMFFIKGDPTIRFNLPHRPLFDPLTAGLFLAGLAILVWMIFAPSTRDATRRKGSHHLLLAARVFLLAVLPVMLLPSALAVGGLAPSNLRAVGLLPFVYVLPALGLVAIVNGLRRILVGVQRHILLAGAGLLILVASAVPTAIAYFRDWAPSAPLYYAADGDLAQIATYLNWTELDETTPYVASVHYRHPTMAFLAQDYAKIRWLTGGRTIVFPDQHEGLLFIPRSASDDLDWIQAMLPEDALFTGRVGPDFRPAFHAYRVDSTDVPAPSHAVTADFGHAADLLGYQILNRPRSGESVEVAVWWRVLNVPAQGDYKPIVRLADPWAFTWGETQPFHYPSEQWTSGEVIVDHLSLPIAPGAPPGDYALRFGFYSPGADQRLPVLDESGAYAGTYVELPVRLRRAPSPPALAALDIRQRLDVPLGDLTLLGANLDTRAARPGERLYLTLFWRADDTPRQDHTVTLTLGEATLYEGAPVHDSYPTDRWTAGEIVADRYNPRLPREMPAGDQPLRVHVAGASVELGSVAVEATERSFEPPPVAHPISATLGGQIALLGYDLSAQEFAPGETLTLTLYWRALTEMEEDYTIFTHLVAPDGAMSGQKDSQPVGGTYPTSLWMAGEVITDVYEIPVRADAASGDHRLVVGMYDGETGARLPIAGSRDNALVLRAITIAAP